MSFTDKLSALLPFAKKEEVLEYFFALNISTEKLTAALWQLEGRHLKILETAQKILPSIDEIAPVTDKLLDAVLGIREIEPQKILFGVPSIWLKDDNLKEENLKILRKLVKDLELTPMAYVESANALVHLLEKTEGIPPTAILVGFEQHHLTATVTRAGKLDGVKIVSRGDNSGADIEKALLSFTAVETLPSKILIYGDDIENLKNQLLSFPWMSKLSFLHFPKIDTLEDEVEIKSVCLAGASELESNVIYIKQSTPKKSARQSLLSADEMKDEDKQSLPSKEGKKAEKELRSQDIAEKADKETEDKKDSDLPKEDENTNLKSIPEDMAGFIVGDVSEQAAEEEKSSLGESDEVEEIVEENHNVGESLIEDTHLQVREQRGVVESEDFVQGQTKRFSLVRFVQRRIKSIAFLVALAGVLAVITGAFLFVPKAEVKIFVEPKILEKDTQVVADPNQKNVDENAKIIPGKVVNTEVSGSSKETATGKKQIGDPAKGTVIIYNKTSEKQSISKGAILSSSNSLKFTLDTSVTIASQSASDSGITYGKVNATVTATAPGADGNLASGSELSVAGFSNQQVSAKAEGNFSGGTSKTVTVVSSDDQSKLLAVVSSDLRKKAQQKLQEELKDKKILEESLSEEIVKKSFSKNVNDQASEFSLNLTSKFKGTAFDDKDLRIIVSKLITTDVPEGFELNLEDTETQADVSKLEKDGKLIFLAKFKAKLMPKIDTEKVKGKLKGKTATQAEEIIKGMDNVLGSEIKFTPSLPKFLQIIPFLERNIKVEVGLK